VKHIFGPEYKLPTACIVIAINGYNVKIKAPWKGMPLNTREMYGIVLNYIFIIFLGAAVF
jgi:hypothetical protein